MPAAGETSVRGLGASPWSHTEGVDTPVLFCQPLESVGSEHQLLEPVRVMDVSQWSGNGVCSQNQLLRGLG